MKIVCESCQAKYSISDDKVRGKAFKIRCKKCSHIIVVRSADAGNLSPGPEPVSGAIATPENSWHIVVDGEQVGPLSASDIRARLARGEISGETYIWREGLTDWLKVSSVAEFSGGAADDEGGAPFPAQSATTVYPPGTAESAFAASPGDEPDAFAASTTISPASAHSDLFASPMASQQPSAPSSSFSYGTNGQEPQQRGGYGNGAAAAAPGGSMTGQRHENSVLFSLSNLEALAAPSAPGSVAPRPGVGSSATSEGSGLIDIRSMAAMTLGSSQNESRPSNDLPTFGAPQFSPVSPVLLPMGNAGGSPKWVLPFIGGLGLIALVLGIATYKMWTRPAPAPVATAPAPELAPAPVAPVTAPKAAARPTAPPTTPQPAANEALPPREPTKTAAAERASSSKASHGARASHDKRGGKSESAGGDKSAPVAAAPKAEPADTKPNLGKGDKLDDLLSAALGSKPSKGSGGGSRSRNDDEDSGSKKAAAPAAASLAPLEKGDIVKAMMGVNGKVRECYNQYKVPGTAMVGLKIARGGKVTDANVSGKFAGTPTGTCVENAVKSAKFPPCDAQSLQYPFSLH